MTGLLLYSEDKELQGLALVTGKGKDCYPPPKIQFGEDVGVQSDCRWAKDEGR